MKTTFTIWLVFACLASADFAQTATGEATVQSPASPSPPVRKNSPYRVLRCGEVLNRSGLIPPDTRARDLAELNCDELAVAWPCPPSSHAERTSLAGMQASPAQIREFCEQRQQEARSILQKRVMTADRQAIRTQCLAEWPGDYWMRNFCEEQQIKASAEPKRKR
jgi:hypothetical protein